MYGFKSAERVASYSLVIKTSRIYSIRVASSGWETSSRETTSVQMIIFCNSFISLFPIEVQIKVLKYIH